MPVLFVPGRDVRTAQGKLRKHDDSMILVLQKALVSAVETFGVLAPVAKAIHVNLNI